MSKLERLNARVAKLLTAAVQEVLSAVKETVAEYQQKTLRTQRENESLKRKLSELQDKFNKENAEDLSITDLLLETTNDAEDRKQDLSLLHYRDPDVSSTEPTAMNDERGFRATPGNRIDHEMGAEHRKGRPEERIETGEEVNAPHPETRELDAAPFRTSGIESPTIKTEMEEGVCTSPRGQQQAGCLGSSRSSSPDAFTEERYGFVFVGSNPAKQISQGGSDNGRRIRSEQLGRDKLHPCVVCGKTFGRPANLRTHQRCHTGERPYGCAQCGRRFSQAWDLKKHKRVHTGEKPYYCSQCGKSFSRAENLRRHQRIHVGESVRRQRAWRELQ